MRARGGTPATLTLMVSEHAPPQESHSCFRPETCGMSSAVGNFGCAISHKKASERENVRFPRSTADLQTNRPKTLMAEQFWDAFPTAYGFRGALALPPWQFVEFGGAAYLFALTC